MQKGSFAMVLASFLFIFLSIPQVLLAESLGKIIFCNDIDDKLLPVGAAESFSTNVVSWRSQAKKPYGKPEIIISTYKKDGEKEKLLTRQKMQVRPTWDVSAMRNFALPGEGMYVISLDLPDGTPISSGVVTITKVRSEPAPRAEVLGDTVADIFKKYKPNN